MEKTFWKKKKKSEIDGLSQSESTSGVLTKIAEDNYYHDALVYELPKAFNYLVKNSWYSKNCTGYRVLAESIERTGTKICTSLKGIWWLPFGLFHSLCQQDEAIPFWMYFERPPYDGILHLRKFKNDYDELYSSWPLSYVYWLYKKECYGDEIRPLLDSLKKRPDLLSLAKQKKEKVYYILTPDTLTMGVMKSVDNIVPVLKRDFTVDYFVALETVKILPTLVVENALSKEQIMEYYLSKYEDTIETFFDNNWYIDF